MRSRKCNEIPQMPKGMASDLRQPATDSCRCQVHPIHDQVRQMPRLATVFRQSRTAHPATVRVGILRRKAEPRPTWRLIVCSAGLIHVQALCYRQWHCGLSYETHAPRGVGDIQYRLAVLPWLWLNQVARPVGRALVAHCSVLSDTISLANAAGNTLKTTCTALTTEL